jgi:hypothetical protein
MFDKYVIVDGSLRNVEREGEPVGFCLDARIPYYRGLGLSMVGVDVTVDGETLPRSDVTFSVHGQHYRSDEMDEVFDDRWGFTEPATLSVDRPGGLTPGDHEVTLKVSLRVSYSPNSGATDSKRLAVA